MSIKSIYKLARPLYQPIELAEFSLEPAVQPCVERWAMIAPRLPERSLILENSSRKLVVDYGCNTGWMVRQFARHGWDATGIDKASDLVKVARYVTDQEQFPIKPRFIEADAMRLTPMADVALCLSVAMYLFDDREAGWMFFRKVSEASPMLFMDFGGMYAGRLPFDESNVVEQMLGHTTYRHSELIGLTNLERPMFLFTRDI